MRCRRVCNRCFCDVVECGAVVQRRVLRSAASLETTACSLVYADVHTVLMTSLVDTAGLAAVYERSPLLDGCNTVVVEVCGGALVENKNLREWMA